MKPRTIHFEFTATLAPRSEESLETGQEQLIRLISDKLIHFTDSLRGSGGEQLGEAFGQSIKITASMSEDISA